MTLEIFFINSTNMRIRQTCLRNLTWIVANFFQSSLVNSRMIWLDRSMGKRF